MKSLIIRLLTISLFSIALGSCSSMEDIISGYPNISNLSNTDCLSHFDMDNEESRSDLGKGTFEMIFDGDVAKCKFTSLEYPCDYERVNIKIIYDEGTMTIVEYPSSDTADCRCEVDASFIIRNIPENDFILKIYHGNTDGNYSNASLKYKGLVNQTDGSITILY